MPFANQAAAQANRTTNYFSPGLTNYLEIVGGSNFGILAMVFHHDDEDMVEYSASVAERPIVLISPGGAYAIRCEKRKRKRCKFFHELNSLGEVACGLVPLRTSQCCS